MSTSIYNMTADQLRQRLLDALDAEAKAWEVVCRLEDQLNALGIKPVSIVERAEARLPGG